MKDERMRVNGKPEAAISSNDKLATVICPVCNAAMKRKTKYTLVCWDQIEGDNEYRLDSIYSCKNNHAAVVYDEHSDTWQIPKEFAPTDKQVKCAQFIEYTLKLTLPIPTKANYWKFINTYLPAASKHKQNEYDYREYDEWDFATAIPEEACF